MPTVKLLCLVALALAFSATCGAATLARVEQATFGKLKDGTAVHAYIYTLSGTGLASSRR